jgi:hypothetical protein
MNLAATKNGSSRFFAIIGFILDIVIISTMPIFTVYPFLVVLSTVGMIGTGSVPGSSLRPPVAISALIISALILYIETDIRTAHPSPHDICKNIFAQLGACIIFLILSRRGRCVFRGVSIIAALCAVTGTWVLYGTLISVQDGDIAVSVFGIITFLLSRRTVAIIMGGKFSCEFATMTLIFSSIFFGPSQTTHDEFVTYFLRIIVVLCTLKIGQSSPTSMGNEQQVNEVTAPVIIEIPDIRSRKGGIKGTPELTPENPVETPVTNPPLVITEFTSKIPSISLPELSEDEDEIFARIAQTLP